jgi:hypothetical protein
LMTEARVDDRSAEARRAFRLGIEVEAEVKTVETVEVVEVVELGVCRVRTVLGDFWLCSAVDGDVVLEMVVEDGRKGGSMERSGRGGRDLSLDIPELLSASAISEVPSTVFFLFLSLVIRNF